jgi:ferredoxin-NADP reductase
MESILSDIELPGGGFQASTFVTGETTRRPDTGTLVREALEGRREGERALVFVCGPKGLREAVLDAAAACCECDVHCEAFES